MLGWLRPSQVPLFKVLGFYIVFMGADLPCTEESDFCYVLHECYILWCFVPRPVCLSMYVCKHLPTYYLPTYLSIYVSEVLLKPPV